MIYPLRHWIKGLKIRNQNRRETNSVVDQQKFSARRFLPVQSYEQIFSASNRQAAVQCLYDWAGVSSSTFNAYYIETLRRFVELVQLLPCRPDRQAESETGSTDFTNFINFSGANKADCLCNQAPIVDLNRNESAPDQLVDCLLLESILILKRRQGIVANRGECEQADFNEIAWTYAAFTAGLAKELGRLVTDYDVLIYTKSGQCLGKWNVLAAAMPFSLWYQYRILEKSLATVQFNQDLSLLMAAKILPDNGLLRLRKNTELFEMWCRVIAGDSRSQLGKIVYGLQNQSANEGPVESTESTDLSDKPERCVSDKKKLITECCKGKNQPEKNLSEKSQSGRNQSNNHGALDGRLLSRYSE